MRDNGLSGRFTDAELDTARSTDLPSLLESLGYHITRKGSFHSTTEMDSLRIKNRRTWFRYSENVGGDAITFLEHFQGMPFTDAVRHLLAFNGYARDAPVLRTRPTPPALPAETGAPLQFVLPPAHADRKRVYAYLRKRGICHQVIAGFIDAELLYEDTEHHNCVFVGKDAEDTPVFAFKRGTYDQGGSGFKHSVGPKLVYICAPLRGDVEKNIAFAKEKAREVFLENNIPVCPHLMFPPIADPNNPIEDEKALSMCKALIDRCSEIRVYGSEWTSGMWEEINYASRYKIPILTDQAEVPRAKRVTSKCR